MNISILAIDQELIDEVTTKIAQNNLRKPNNLPKMFNEPKPASNSIVGFFI